MPYQFDFLKHITTCRDTGHNVIICKAFDIVPRQTLTQKLKNFGIDNPLLSLIRSFLHNRFLKVKPNNTTAKPTPLTSDFMQGSVQGPLLFLLYIID